MKNTKSATALLLLALVTASVSAQTRGRVPAPRRPNAERPRMSPPPAAKSEAIQDLETLIAADSYGLYAEVRKAGQLLRSEEFTQVLDSLQSIRGPNPDAKEFEAFIFYFTAQAEALNNTTVMLGMMPTREKLPLGLVAFQFPTIEAAAEFEPKLRDFLVKQLGSGPSMPPESTEARSPLGLHAAGKQTAGGRKRQGSPTVQLPFHLKRIGNLLFAADRAFTLKDLKPEESQTLAAAARFQSMRSRFASEPLFIYFELNGIEKGFAHVSQESMKQLEMERGNSGPATATDLKPEGDASGGMNSPPVRIEIQPDEPFATATESPTPAPDPSSSPMANAGGVVGGEIGEPKNKVGTNGEAAPTPNEAALIIPLLFSRLTGGVSRWPEAVGIALGFEKDDYVVRVLLANSASAPPSLVPFFPALATGPLSTLEASSIAPAETEIFGSVSVDWQRVYDTMLSGTPDAPPAPPNETTPVPAKASPTVEDAVKMFEKAVGFKIRDDLLPALGNEIALSAPVEWFNGSTVGRQSKTGEAAETQSRAGCVVMLSLHNPEAMRKMLPRLLEVSGMKSPLAAGKTEKRGDVEINTYTGVSVAFINNYVALTNDTAALRHFVDAGQQTLISNQNFRSATNWQPRQKLGSIYVSPALMEHLQDDAKKMLDPDDTDFQNLFAGLYVHPTAATYAVTGEGGDELLHELRLPKGLIKILSAQTALTAKRAALIQNEYTAMSHLRTIHAMEEEFKTGNGRYGSLDELLNKSPQNEKGIMLKRSELERMPYRFEVTASGEKFQVTATPKEYSRATRRSFLIDESGALRGADHKGELATADDPPID